MDNNFSSIHGISVKKKYRILAHPWVLDMYWLYLTKGNTGLPLGQYFYVKEHYWRGGGFFETVRKSYTLVAFYQPPKSRNLKFRKIIAPLQFNFFDCGFHFFTP